MKRANPFGIRIIILVACIPVIYLAAVYDRLPATVPLHFNINGDADRIDSKAELWFPVLLLAIVSVGVYALISNLRSIDPKKTAGLSPDLYQKIGAVVTVFFCALNLVIIHAAQQGSLQLNKFLLPLLGLFFAVLGNYMHSIKPNYFVGFRTPWTLENEDNWRKTHQLVGKLWVPGGLLVTISSLLLPAKAGLVVFLCIIGIITLVPAVYSYLYFKKNAS